MHLSAVHRTRWLLFVSIFSMCHLRLMSFSPDKFSVSVSNRKTRPVLSPELCSLKTPISPFTIWRWDHQMKINHTKKKKKKWKIRIVPVDTVPKIFPSISLKPGTPAAAAANPQWATANLYPWNRSRFQRLMATTSHRSPQCLINGAKTRTFQILQTAAWTRKCSRWCWTQHGTPMENCC